MIRRWNDVAKLVARGMKQVGRGTVLAWQRGALRCWLAERVGLRDT